MEILKPIVLPTCEKEVFDKVLIEGDNTFAVGIAEISITYAQEAPLDVALPKEDPNEPDLPELEYLKITGAIDEYGPEYVFQIETPEGPWTFEDASELVSLLNDFKSRLTATQFEAQKPNVKAEPQPKQKIMGKGIQGVNGNYEGAERVSTLTLEFIVIILGIFSYGTVIFI